MRKFLANVVSTIGSWTIDVIDRSYPLFIGLVNLTYRVARTLAANIFYLLIKAASKEAVEEAEESIKLKQQHIELALLDSIAKIRDDALANDDWTDSHTVAVNSAGQALVDSCQWDPADVHSYIKEVVETIDGLTYDADGDD